MFSNSTDYFRWIEYNCEQCIKYECESYRREQAGCKLAFDLDLGSVTGELPPRADKIISAFMLEGKKCPYLKTERKKYAKKDKTEGFI